MNSMLIAVAIAVVVSIALVVVSTVLVANKIRERKAARAERIRREKMHLLNDFEVSFGKKINIKGKEAFITEVAVNGHKYESVREALLQENVSGRRMRQMLELEAELEFMRKSFMPKVEEEVTEARIENEEKRVEKDEKKQYTVLSTGKEVEGDVFIYQPGLNIPVSPFMSIEIVRNQDNSMYVRTVLVSKEGLRDGMYETRYDLTNAPSLALYQHYVEGDKAFKDEVSTVHIVQERMKKYNDLVKEKRLLWDSGKQKWVIIPKPITKPDSPKDVVDAQFKEEQPEEVNFTLLV